MYGSNARLGFAKSECFDWIHPGVVGVAFVMLGLRATDVGRAWPT